MKATVAVIDIGKSNVRLNAATPEGAIAETISTPNHSLPAPPYQHHDLAGLEDWLLDGLARLGKRHPIEAIVTCTHGSGGVLVDRNGPVLPQMDYEQEPPADLNALYVRLAGSYRERGSAMLSGCGHLARQLLWMETGWPEAFRRGAFFLGLPQYWAWRFGGAPATEYTYLGAQSHIWNVRDHRPPAIVEQRGWGRLLPPIRPAWESLGTLKPELAARTGLSPQTRLLCGIHDSSANFYRYQAAGLSDVTIVSTGTWIVLVSNAADPEAISEEHGMCCNADVHGAPLAGVLCMGGREYAAVAGDLPPGLADPAEVARLVAAGTMALPSFSSDEVLFPGHANRGRIVGPAPEGPQQRRALAVLYVALLIDACLDTLSRVGTVVLDGVFVKEPLYAGLLAAMRPQEKVRFNLESYGTAAGAAMLAGHATRAVPAALALESPRHIDIPGLAAYRQRWLSLAHAPVGSAEADVPSTR